MNSPRRLAQTWSCCKAPTSQLSHLVLIVTFPDMDLLNLEFKDEVTLLPGAPLMALTQHWLEADKDPVWSHFQVCALCAQARSMFSGRATGTHVSAAERAAPQRTPSATDGPSPPPRKHTQGRISQEALWASTHVVHFSQPGKPWYWNSTGIREKYPKAHPRLHEAFDSWHNASAALC